MRRLTERECRRYRTWYADARSLIVREYSNPELFIGLLAATSPRMHVKKNWKTAETIYKSVLRGGPINYGCGMKTHKPNIGRAIRGEPLSGLKVESFKQNLLGSDNHVTIDVWMIRWFGSDKVHVTPKEYRMYAKRCRTNSKTYNMTPAEYQAVAWSAIRSDNGFKAKSFSGVWSELNAQMLLWDLE